MTSIIQFGQDESVASMVAACLRASQALKKVEPVVTGDGTYHMRHEAWHRFKGDVDAAVKSRWDAESEETDIRRMSDLLLSVPCNSGSGVTWTYMFEFGDADSNGACTPTFEVTQSYGLKRAQTCGDTIERMY